MRCFLSGLTKKNEFPRRNSLVDTGQNCTKSVPELAFGQCGSLTARA